MIGNLLHALVLQVEPDERQDGDQWQGGNQAAQLVTALCQLRHDNHYRGSDQVLRNDPSHR